MHFQAISMSKKVLFVCRHNENRSPASQIIAESIMKKKGLEAVMSSAGLSVNPAKTHLKNHLRKVLSDRGYADLASHVPQQLNQDILDSSDLVLTMNSEQSGDIIDGNSFDKSKLFTLPQYASGKTHSSSEIRLPGYATIDLTYPYRNESENTALAENLSMLPTWMARTYLSLSGSGLIDGRDKDKLYSVYSNFVDNLEKYIGKAIDRMQKEGLFK